MVSAATKGIPATSPAPFNLCWAECILCHTWLRATQSEPTACHLAAAAYPLHRAPPLFCRCHPRLFSPWRRSPCAGAGGVPRWGGAHGVWLTASRSSNPAAITGRPRGEHESGKPKMESLRSPHLFGGLGLARHRRELAVGRAAAPCHGRQIETRPWGQKGQPSPVSPGWGYNGRAGPCAARPVSQFQPGPGYGFSFSFAFS
jgi:hypothetical protein